MTLPFSATSTTNGAEINTKPENSGTSTRAVRPASTRTVRLAVTPSAPVTVTTWRPTLMVSSVSGVSPAGFPSIVTRAPTGSVVIVKRVAPLATAGSAGAGALIGAAFLTVSMLGPVDGV